MKRRCALAMDPMEFFLQVAFCRLARVEAEVAEATEAAEVMAEAVTVDGATEEANGVAADGARTGFAEADMAIPLAGGDGLISGLDGHPGSSANITHGSVCLIMLVCRTTADQK